MYLQTMLQELSSRKRMVENFKEKFSSVSKLMDGKDIIDSSEDVISRYDTLVSNLADTVSINEKCSDNVQQYQNDLKHFRDELRQLWETLSSHTGRKEIILTKNLHIYRFYLQHCKF